MKIRVPKPVMVFADFPRFTAYAWKCEHKKHGVQTLGDSKKEATESFKEAIGFELCLAGTIADENDVVFV